MWQLGGAIARRPIDATAYRHRDAAYSFNIFSRWENPEEDEDHIAWTQEFFDEATPYLADGVYVNSLGKDEAERVPDAYGEHYDRLRDLKNKWDPENLFRMNQNIEPTV